MTCIANPIVLITSQSSGQRPVCRFSALLARPVWSRALRRSFLAPGSCLTPDPIGLEIEAPSDICLSVKFRAEHVSVSIAGEQE